MDTKTPIEMPEMIQNHLSSQSDRDKAKHYINRLRVQFLTPIAVTLVFAVSVIMGTVYVHESQTLESDLAQLQSNANGLYQNNLKQNAKALQTIMDVLNSDEELITALTLRDRQRLLKRASSLYKDMNRHYNITHFYFTDTDRVNLLRVHKPAKFGDTINRQTTITAQTEGLDAYGVELGPLGTLTLRYVQPWYDKQSQELVGYVELGMEVDQTVHSISSLLGIDTFVLINKQYLDQAGWEDGIKTFGGGANWNHFSQVVVSIHGGQSLPEALSETIADINFKQYSSDFKRKLAQGEMYAIFQPIKDVTGRDVGHLVMLLDTTEIYKHMKESVIIGSIALTLSAIVLMIFFYWLVGRIGLRMVENEIKLEQMATHDSLTGLFNRRQFNLMLEDAIERHTRYLRPISLLMIDIDFFKNVNDTHGHLVGDSVLIELANRLTQQVRKSDRVCRYGGEEFIVLMPETDSESAEIFAHRLCKTIGAAPLVLEDGTTLTVTVSIGISSYMENTGSSLALVDAADHALYTAKESGRNCAFNYGEVIDELKLGVPA